MIWLSAISPVATPNTSHPVTLDSNSAQISTASQHSQSPGNTGITMPSSPIRMTTPMKRLPVGSTWNILTSRRRTTRTGSRAGPIRLAPAPRLADRV